MLYKIITLKTGEKLKYEIGKYTEAEVKKHFGDNLVSITDGFLINENLVEEKKTEPFWKVRMSYSDESLNFNVGKEEILKVYYAFIRGSKVVLSTGAVRGSDIISITPNYILCAGWNEGYKPSAEELRILGENKTVIKLKALTAEIKQVCIDARNYQDAENNFNLLLETTDLLLLK